MSLKGDVVAEAEHCLRLRPDLQFVFIADGAPDNWSFCEKAFPGATQVLDCWHALQHLKEALDAAYGEGSPEAWHRFEKLRETLKEGEDGIGKVIRALRRLAKKHPRRKPITRVLNFFKKQQHRMRYAEVHARGMPIGSGAVESSNKVLHQDQDEGRRDALVGERHRSTNPHFPCLVEVRPLRCSMAANLPRTGAAGVRIPKPAATQHLDNGKLARFTL